MRSIQVFLTSLVLGAALTACGGADEPAAVCTSVTDLSDSVGALQKVDLTSSGGFADLKDALAAVRTDLGQVRSDAQDEFSDEFKGVGTSFDDLRAAIEDVASTPSLAALSAVQTRFVGFRHGIQGFRGRRAGHLLR